MILEKCKIVVHFQSYENISFMSVIVRLPTIFIYRRESLLSSFTECDIMTHIYVKLLDKLVMNAPDYIQTNINNPPLV